MKKLFIDLKKEIYKLWENNLELSNFFDEIFDIKMANYVPKPEITPYEEIIKKWGKLDFLVHAIGFSNKEELRGKYLDTSLENFKQTMHISCYSFTEACKYAENLMTNGGSILTLTYYGSEQVMPHYNVMGLSKAALETSVKYIASDLGEKNIRVNAISAGPIKTLAASGIGDFRFILKWNEYNSPLKRNISQNEVGKASIYLLSNLSSAITGEIHHLSLIHI